MTSEVLALGFLAWVRVGTLLFVTPLLGSMSSPLPFKVFLGAFIAVAIVGAAAPALGQPHVDALSPDLPLLVVREALIGAVLGFGVQAAFAIFSIAGALLDVQIGLGLGSVYDPVLRSQSPILSAALMLFGSVLFFQLGAHRDLIRSIAYSFQSLPIGSHLGENTLPLLIKQFSVMFTMAVAYVSPVLLGLLLIEIGLSVLSRAMPQMNIIFIGVPIKIFAGLVLLSLIVPFLATPTARIFQSLFIYFREVAI